MPAAARWPMPVTTHGRLQAYLGHKNIQHTVRYTELAPTRFKDFWR
jgi:site-specific recombinase XerD